MDPDHDDSEGAFYFTCFPGENGRDCTCSIDFRGYSSPSRRRDVAVEIRNRGSGGQWNIVESLLKLKSIAALEMLNLRPCLIFLSGMQ